ncbi:hypothetical protein [Methylobacterium oxalidis]|uniref:hypothetical protein n=1 Tax=Methylobacterium oxalidis TaxID=944322 RepID=UPI003314E441
MAERGIVVDFPTGRRLEGSARDRKSIRQIASDLARGLAHPGSDPAGIVTLPIRLDELSGISDETIARLSALACDGTITPASAARFALQHAREAGGSTSRCLRPRASRRGHRRLDLTLSGDPFGTFALHLRNGENWVGFAPATCLDRLFAVCPDGVGSICLLVGSDAARRTTVRILAADRWRSRLLRLLSIPRGRSVRHVLVLGGLPPGGPSRSCAMATLGNALRKAGSTALRGPMARVETAVSAPSRPMRDLLMLIELASPGLVDLGIHDEDAAR